MKLKRIVESYGAEGQFYDLGKDFASFRRMIDGADQQIRQQYEQQISKKLVGKRVRARASRGYKQYVKDYEFDVARISLDDYYDNFVIVAHDSTTPKPKEYFLKPGFKVQILGPATGQPSPQKGGKPDDLRTQGNGPTQQPPAPNAQHQKMALAPVGATAPSEQEPVKEDEQLHGAGYYDAYSIDSITQDVKDWIPQILEKPGTAIRDFIKGLGWQRDLGKGTVVAMFDLKIPANAVKKNVPVNTISKLVSNASKDGSSMRTNYQVVKMEPDDKKGFWLVRIKKTITDKSAI